jgi:methyltransferase (TIGR00027 family)
MNPVAITGLLVAAIRAEETRRPDALFRDPFAEGLAGADGRAALARYRGAAGAHRIGVGTNLFGDWPAALVAHGFEPGQRTVWLVEGVLQYLAQPMVETLFERLSRASAPGSIALYDAVGRSLLDSPALAVPSRRCGGAARLSAGGDKHLMMPSAPAL